MFHLGMTAAFQNVQVPHQVSVCVGIRVFQRVAHAGLGGQVDHAVKLLCGNSSPVELMDYITALEEALGMEAKKNMMPIQPGDVLDTSADTQPLYDLVGFKPQTSVKEGVKNFVEWYKNYYQI